MSKVFVIADTHFGHKNIIKFHPQERSYNTIEEHDRDLIARWNAVVNKDDTVIHLGDVLFGKHSFDLLKELKGYKRLILGNHDHYPLEEYQKYFPRIYGALAYQNFILTHVPVHPNQMERFHGNIHGHMHSSALDDPRYFCVSCERIACTPVPIGKVIAEIFRRKNKI